LGELWLRSVKAMSRRWLGHYVAFFIVRYVVGTILFIVLLVYKWRRRHLSAYENIENYL